MSDDRREITVCLNADDALVLSSLLHRWIDRERAQTIRALVEDDAELWALNNLNCEFESIVSEAFSSEYQLLLSAARRRVRERHGGDWPLSVP